MFILRRVLHHLHGKAKRARVRREAIRDLRYRFALLEVENELFIIEPAEVMERGNELMTEAKTGGFNRRDVYPLERREIEDARYCPVCGTELRARNQRWVQGGILSVSAFQLVLWCSHCEDTPWALSKVTELPTYDGWLTYPDMHPRLARWVMPVLDAWARFTCYMIGHEWDSHADGENGTEDVWCTRCGESHHAQF